ncbi:hypothetical protein HWV62_30272 [Athelia sp. TMB]|nr:hypothetical protein HWV62_30272 [Athelia sp. TMB]
MLTAFKCDHEGKKFSTAEGIRSAFKSYFERVHGCQGDYWRFNSQQNCWEGNPVFQAEYNVYYESLKNRSRRTDISTQALPMLPADLAVIMSWLDSSECAQQMSEMKRLYFKAFATTAFALWSRRHVRTNQVTPAGCLYTEFRLVLRKTNKDLTKGQTYMIPPDPESPHTDCHYHMNQWLHYLEAQMQRPLEPFDYIFPSIASTGQLKYGEAISRGGAQYRFMLAKRKWSLKAVKWWGGWSSSENVGTIMRYLLDELMAYKEGFGDILMKDRALDHHETFMGESDTSATLTKLDLEVFQVKLLQQVRDMVIGAFSDSLF